MNLNLFRVVLVVSTCAAIVGSAVITIGVWYKHSDLGKEIKEKLKG